MIAKDVPKPRILPIYPLTEGVKQSDLRRLTADVVGKLSDSLAEVMPLSLRQRAVRGVGGIKHSTRPAAAGDHRGD